MGKPASEAGRSADPLRTSGGHPRPVPAGLSPGEATSEGRQLPDRATDWGAKPKGTPDRPKLRGPYGQGPWRQGSMNPRIRMLADPDLRQGAVNLRAAIQVAIKVGG